MMVVHIASDAFVGTVAQSLFGICASKSGSCWMNLPSCWPTTVWLQLLLCPYQLIVDCYLFNCNGALVLCVCWHVTIIMAIMVIVIIKWHWHLDAFNGLITLILALGFMLGICSCVTRRTQIRGSARLVMEVLCTFRHQLCVECDITAAFLPHQGYPLVHWLIIVMTLVTKVAFILWHFGLPRLVAIDVDMICHLVSDYHCFLRLAAWTTWLRFAVVGALCTHQCKYIHFIIHNKKG